MKHSFGNKSTSSHMHTYVNMSIRKREDLVISFGVKMFWQTTDQQAICLMKRQSWLVRFHQFFFYAQFNFKLTFLDVCKMKHTKSYNNSVEQNILASKGNVISFVEYYDVFEMNECVVAL